MIFHTTDPDIWQKVFAWALRQQGPVCWLDRCGFDQYPHAPRPLLVGVGAVAELCTPNGAYEDTFARLSSFLGEKKYWTFGFLTYDLKNETEELRSEQLDPVESPEAYFFHAETVLQWDGEAQWTIFSEKNPPEQVWSEILATEPYAQRPVPPLDIRARMERDAYLQSVAAIREHIIDGDVYELNFCQAFYAENAKIDPASLFLQLKNHSPAPFSGYFRQNGQHLVCASPERFLSKKGQQLTSQPIKGTAPRGAHPEEDRRIARMLYSSEKNRAENVMIVDLVRNDLARSCLPGSVKVEELFGVYAFPQVWQMISTVAGTLRPEVSGVTALKNAFPMGSMTGAPKVKSMELIERYENSKRGLYSGTLGYFAPNGDFDFNVVIRSLLYNESKQYLTFSAGGAIVYDSVPEEEYAECLAKVKGILNVLRGGMHQR